MATGAINEPRPTESWMVRTRMAVPMSSIMALPKRTRNSSRAICYCFVFLFFFRGGGGGSRAKQGKNGSGVDGKCATGDYKMEM